MILRNQLQSEILDAIWPPEARRNAGLCHLFHSSEENSQQISAFLNALALRDTGTLEHLASRTCPALKR